MKNKFTIFLLGVLLVPIACRTENDYVEKQDAKQSFATFYASASNKIAYRKNSKSRKSQIDYASGFAYLLQRHDSIYKKNTTGLVNSSNTTDWDSELKQHFIKNANSAYIEFRIKSQTINEDNQDKWIVFPKIENGKVVDLVAVVLSKEETEVHYYLVKRESNLFLNNLQLFQEKYDKYFSKMNNKMNRTNAYAPNREIEEVIIYSFRSPSYNGRFFIDNNEEIGTGGKCELYYDCFIPPGSVEGGGGHSTNVVPNQNTDPCSNIKSNLTDTNYKLKYNELNKTSNFTEKKEKGFYETKDGWFIGLEQSSSTSTSDGLKVPIADDVKGYTHIHLNDYETGKTDDNGAPEIRKPIRMFSPADVNTLMELANIQTNGSYGDLYGTMLSSEGNYIIKFTGAAANIKTGFDTDDWRKAFKKFIIDEKGSLEKKFLRFLSEKMEVTGVSLYKINSDGTVEQKSLSSNNKISSTKCP